MKTSLARVASSSIKCCRNVTYHIMQPRVFSSHVFSNCIELCNECAAECEHCATECLKEDKIEMLSRCIALARECAIVCTANGQLMCVGGEYASLLCHPCAVICNACAEECASNAQLAYCHRCAEVCRECAEECFRMIEQLQV